VSVNEPAQFRSAARRIALRAADWHVQFLNGLVELGQLDDDQADRLAEAWDHHDAPHLTI
jgi:hypothetical protein